MVRVRFLPTARPVGAVKEMSEFWAKTKTIWTPRL